MVKRAVQYGPPSVDKALGALPVVAEFCRRLDIAGIVDRACSVRDLAILTHGQVIEALVANRLTSPAPMVHVEEWARAWALEEIFGIDPDALSKMAGKRTFLMVGDSKLVSYSNPGGRCPKSSDQQA